MLEAIKFAQDRPESMTVSNVAKPNQMLDEIWRNIQLKQLDSAILLSQKLCKDHPDFAHGWHAQSVICAQQGNDASALENINRALLLSPSYERWSLHKATLLFNSGQRADSRKTVMQILTKPHTNVGILSELALLLNKLGLHQQSHDFYKQALAIQPDNTELLFNFASLQRFMGKLQEAQQTLDQLIKLNPRDSEAWLLRSGLSKQNQQGNHISELQSALTKPMRPISKAQLFYALGKELEDLQRYEEAFIALAQGASVRRANMQYSVDNDLQTLEKITEVFDSKRLNQNTAGHDNDQPIFIVGLPRTGSTLVERILGNHTDVFSAGELNNFALQMMQQVRLTADKPPNNKLALIEATSKLNFAELGHSYIASTQPDTDASPRFIDKLPLNSLYVGLIHLALPKAKIIYVQRNPMDTCFAIFKNMFTQGYPFSYDLQELSSYQIAHHNLMAHWDKALPGVLHIVKYENLVADIEGETNKLLEYCQLPWQSKCSEFQRNAAAATTASSAQVRQPLYSSSIGKWKHFAKQLSDVERQFRQAGILCD